MSAGNGGKGPGAQQAGGQSPSGPEPSAGRLHTRSAGLKPQSQAGGARGMCGDWGRRPKGEGHGQALGPSSPPSPPSERSHSSDPVARGASDPSASGEQGAEITGCAVWLLAGERSSFWLPASWRFRGSKVRSFASKPGHGVSLVHQGAGTPPGFRGHQWEPEGVTGVP